MKRKSPYEHPVGAHVRDGRPVVNYRRGQGDKPQPIPRRSRVVGDINSPFDVTVFYIGEAREKFVVGAENYGVALDAGIEMRDKPLPPKQIRMRRVR